MAFFQLYTRVGYYVLDNPFEGVIVAIVVAYFSILQAEKSSGEHQGRSPLCQSVIGSTVCNLNQYLQFFNY